MTQLVRVPDRQAEAKLQHGLQLPIRPLQQPWRAYLNRCEPFCAQARLYLLTPNRLYAFPDSRPCEEGLSPLWVSPDGSLYFAQLGSRHGALYSLNPTSGAWTRYEPDLNIAELSRSLHLRCRDGRYGWCGDVVFASLMAGPWGFTKVFAQSII